MTRRKQLLADERGTLIREAPTRIALCSPTPYHVAMSSLGYQAVYRMLNERPSVAAERVVLPDRGEGRAPLRSLETGRPASDFDLLAVSATWDLDIVGLFELLRGAGLPPLASERSDAHPAVILGGPLTTSNPLPFGPFIDLAVIGEGELVIPRLLDLIEASPSRRELAQAAAELPGVWVPAVHADRVPPGEVTPAELLPAVGQVVTPHTELSNMFLVEASRGCPRSCRFCLSRASANPWREAPVDAVLAAIPDDALRVGFVGAAVSEWSGLRAALRQTLARDVGVGVSSLRADRLDAELVELLARGGYRTLTVAADASSQRLRDEIGKGIRTRHLLEAARLARAARMQRLKLYAIVGLPGEQREDVDELVQLVRELAGQLPVAVAASPLVPKLHTPLGDAEFAGIDAVDATLRRLRRALGGVAEVRSASGRWAWIEYRLSQGGQDVGLAALTAWREGGRFAAWRDTLAGAEERGALRAAREAGLWTPAGMK